MSQSHASHTLRKLAAEGEITGFQLGGGFVYMESLPHGPNVKSVLSHLIRIGMAANIWIHRPDHNKLTSLLTHLNKLAANLDIALNESHSDE